MDDLFNERTPRDKLPIDAQIAAVNREISLREAVYAKMIVNGKMSRAKAERQIAEMEAVRDTLAWVRDNKLLIVDALIKKTEGESNHE